MKRFVFACLLAASAVIVTTPAWSQAPGGGRRGMGGGGGFGSLMGLVGQKSVQADLKLTEDETKNVEKVAGKAREASGDLQNASPEERREKMQAIGAANEKALAEVLPAEKIKRLKQIAVQAQGVGAIRRPEVAEALALTAEQKEKIQAIGSDLQAELRDAGAGEDREASAKKTAAARKAATEKMLGVFTDAQKAKWSELTGEPFTGELQQGPGMGGRRGGDRPAGAGAAAGGRPKNDA